MTTNSDTLLLLLKDDLSIWVDNINLYDEVVKFLSNIDEINEEVLVKIIDIIEPLSSKNKISSHSYEYYAYFGFHIDDENPRYYNLYRILQICIDILNEGEKLENHEDIECFLQNEKK